jgi:hypothetical protein
MSYRDRYRRDPNEIYSSESDEPIVDLPQWVFQDSDIVQPPQPFYRKKP